jgi:TPR repeat protein
MTNEIDAAAMNSIGLRFYHGYGAKQDLAEALKWFEKAAALGNIDAMNNISAMYNVGHGVSQDLAKAREWYEKAAAAAAETTQKRKRKSPHGKTIAVIWCVLLD